MRPKVNRQIKIDWRLLRRKKARALYNATIQKELEETDNGDNPSKSNDYSNFVKITIKSAEENIAGEGRKGKDWFKLSKDKLTKAISRVQNYWSGV